MELEIDPFRDDHQATNIFGEEILCEIPSVNVSNQMNEFVKYISIEITNYRLRLISSFNYYESIPLGLISHIEKTNPKSTNNAFDFLSRESRNQKTFRNGKLSFLGGKNNETNNTNELRYIRIQLKDLREFTFELERNLSKQFVKLIVYFAFCLNDYSIKLKEKLLIDDSYLKSFPNGLHEFAGKFRNILSNYFHSTIQVNAQHSTDNYGWSLYDGEKENRRLLSKQRTGRLKLLTQKSYELSPTYPAHFIVEKNLLENVGRLNEILKFRSKRRMPIVSYILESPSIRFYNLTTDFTSNVPMAVSEDLDDITEINDTTFDRDDLTDDDTDSEGTVSFEKERNNEISLCIFRSSQPMIGLNKANVEDQNYFMRIAKRLLVVDARSRIAALANKGREGGVENEKEYKNSFVKFGKIENIHEMRKSKNNLKESLTNQYNLLWKANEGIMSDHKKITLSQQINNIFLNGQDEWLKHIQGILDGANEIVYSLKILKFSILVHCSDGWDRTGQLSALSILMLDEYYRTITGFLCLIEKEWCTVGYKFVDRCGQFQGELSNITHSINEQKNHINLTRTGSDERSPVFQQFLDSLYQLIIQFPNLFEFNENLLLFLAEHQYTSVFGNFLANNEQSRTEQNLMNNTISLNWYILKYVSVFTNRNYSPQKCTIYPITALNAIRIWHKYYGKFRRNRFSEQKRPKYTKLISKNKEDIALLELMPIEVLHNYRLELKRNETSESYKKILNSIRSKHYGVYASSRTVYMNN
ncbi:hypothetical protein SNEBB_005427 [Seison nebaliae]|nr:hypothetical protein SNEBB_005427 [Seison nebaliae]